MFKDHDSPRFPGRFHWISERLAILTAWPSGESDLLVASEKIVKVIQFAPFGGTTAYSMFLHFLTE